MILELAPVPATALGIYPLRNGKPNRVHTFDAGQVISDLAIGDGWFVLRNPGGPDPAP